ncbi:succinate dehydrogenase, iron-sulfur subunit, partial [mine drainage metagenome]
MVEFSLPRNSKVQKGTHHPARDGTKNVRTFRIYRWTPDDGRNPRLDSFDLDVSN